VAVKKIPRPIPNLELGFQDEGRLARGDFSSLDQGKLIGAGQLRLIMFRDQLKRTAGGGYDFSKEDGIVNQARARGINAQIVLSNRKGSGMGDPKKYEQFVKMAGHHFKGRVNRYSLENEPDLRMAPAKYRQLFVGGQRALASADPQARVLFGELSPHDPVGYTKKVVGKKGLTASGFAWHPYQDTDPLAKGTNPYWGSGGIGSARTITRQLGQLNLKTRAGKPLGMYATEFGYGRYGNSNVSEADAAKMWPRAIEQARRAGLKEIVAYHLTGSPSSSGWDTGLLNADGTPRMDYNTLAGAVRSGMLRKRY
jgi:hypothetical protein